MTEKTNGQNRKKENLCMEILENCRLELYHYFPYLDGVFASIRHKKLENLSGLATDGRYLYFGTDDLLKQFKDAPAKLTETYLHMLLHCLYLHIFPPENINPQRWNLACDLAVEQLIERENISELAGKDSPVRNQCRKELAGKAYSAEELYGMLEEGFFTVPERELCDAFVRDDHCLWYEEKEDSRGLKEKWEKLLTYSGQKKRAGQQKGTDTEIISAGVQSRYDYRKFLERFSFQREEVDLDTESFDYIFYTYGLEHYGNMPLIEHLEYREVNRLEELVIAIDTSGSCSAEMVQQFLAETYEMLSRRENFFKKMKVYLIQCDCCIEKVTILHSEEEWKASGREIEICGRGGTDFRPVFRYIKEQQEKRELKNLKALIYFTDGDGIYPESRPEYETAFVGLKEKAQMQYVPAWAMKLLI